jgi:hypothetical protein
MLQKITHVMTAPMPTHCNVHYPTTKMTIPTLPSLSHTHAHHHVHQPYPTRQRPSCTTHDHAHTGHPTMTVTTMSSTLLTPEHHVTTTLVTSCCHPAPIAPTTSFIVSPCVPQLRNIVDLKGASVPHHLQCFSFLTFHCTSTSVHHSRPMTVLWLSHPISHRRIPNTP